LLLFSRLGCRPSPRLDTGLDHLDREKVLIALAPLHPERDEEHDQSERKPMQQHRRGKGKRLTSPGLVVRLANARLQPLAGDDVSPGTTRLPHEPASLACLRCGCT
jgi:hypothetical protein